MIQPPRRFVKRIRTFVPFPGGNLPKKAEAKMQLAPSRFVVELDGVAYLCSFSY
jgi:hypothetical protein